MCDIYVLIKWNLGIAMSFSSDTFRHACYSLCKILFILYAYLFKKKKKRVGERKSVFFSGLFEPTICFIADTTLLQLQDFLSWSPLYQNEAATQCESEVYFALLSCIFVQHYKCTLITLPLTPEGTVRTHQKNTRKHSCFNRCHCRYRCRRHPLLLVLLPSSQFHQQVLRKSHCVHVLSW